MKIAIAAAHSSVSAMLNQQPPLYAREENDAKSTC